MKHVLIALLVVAPLALGFWVLWRGPSAQPRAEPPKKISALPPAAQAKLDADSSLRALLRMPLLGLTAVGETTLYDSQSLFEYIDGAAPLYIERHFRKLATVDLKTGDGGELTCEIYDMQTSSNAESIYLKERPEPSTEANIGEASHKSSMALVLRQDRYYIKLTAFDTQAEQQLPALARVLVERVP